MAKDVPFLRNDDDDIAEEGKRTIREAGRSIITVSAVFGAVVSFLSFFMEGKSFGAPNIIIAIGIIAGIFCGTAMLIKPEFCKSFFIAFLFLGALPILGGTLFALFRTGPMGYLRVVIENLVGWNIGLKSFFGKIFDIVALIMLAFGASTFIRHLYYNYLRIIKDSYTKEYLKNIAHEKTKWDF